jgi:hypothetical protein
MSQNLYLLQYNIKWLLLISAKGSAFFVSANNSSLPIPDRSKGSTMAFCNVKRHLPSQRPPQLTVSVPYIDFVCVLARHIPTGAGSVD